MQFSNSLKLNSSLPLEHFEFSGAQNLDERRSIYQFASSLSKIRTLRNLIIKNCGIGEKTMNLLISGLYNGLGLPNDAGETPKLEILCLAQDFVNTSLVDMASLISLCGSTLQLLDLSLVNINLNCNIFLNFRPIWRLIKNSGPLWNILGGFDLNLFICEVCGRFLISTFSEIDYKWTKDAILSSSIFIIL